MISPIFVIVVLILLFWYLTQQPQFAIPCPSMKCSKQKFTEPAAIEGFEGDKTLSMIVDDPTARRANSTGLKTTGQFVNSAFETPVDDPDFNEAYAKIIADEIGSDVVDSQKAYIANVPSDNRVRFIDTDVSANYGNYVGLSLSRLTAPQVNASNSTQNIGIDTTNYTNNVAGSLRSYLSR